MGLFAVSCPGKLADIVPGSLAAAQATTLLLAFQRLAEAHVTTVEAEEKPAGDEIDAAQDDLHAYRTLAFPRQAHRTDRSAVLVTGKRGARVQV